MAELDSSEDGVLSKREFAAWWTGQHGGNHTGRREPNSLDI